MITTSSRGTRSPSLALGLGLAGAAACFAAAARSGQDGASGRRWASPRQAADGPVLDSDWFAGRKAVVYLVPPGGLPDVRKAAAAVMADRWTAGDWSTKHVFVGGVPSAAVFGLGKRIGLRDAAREVTRAAGQGDELIEENESLVAEHVFFVHDPRQEVWAELLGPDRDGKTGAATALVVLDGGVSAGVVDLRPAASDRTSDAEAGPDPVAAAVRRLLAGEADRVASSEASR